MQNIELLKYLSKKLQTGNTRSIHLNALPGRYATRLDISNLNLIIDLTGKGIDNSLSQFFVETLLTKSEFSFPISFDKINLNKIDENQQKELVLLSKKLDAIYYENNDTFLEHGIKTFGFGFPILIKRDKKDKTKVIKAPLFIWQIEIEKSAKSQNTWTIKREDDFGININEVLISHINADEDIKIDTISNDLLEDSVLDLQEVIDLSKKILNQLNPNDLLTDLVFKLTDCPTKERAESLTDKTPWISWSGVFGLFRTQKQPIIKDIDLLINQFDSFKFDKLVIEKFQTSTVSSVSTDPSQEIIINSLETNPNQIIQGPPGTGKSQSLTALITNALENGATCLIVCEKKTALDVIYNNLQKIGLANLCAIIDDISKDRKRIIDLVRNNINEKYISVSFKESEYNSNLKRFDLLKVDITSKHNNMCKKVFGDLAWKDIIGKYMQSQKTGNMLNLNDKIKAVGFLFNYDEYKELQIIVKRGKYLNKQLPQDTSFLDLTNRSLYKSSFLQSIKNEFLSNIKEALRLSNDLLLLLKTLNDNVDYLQKSISIILKLPKFLVKILPFSKDTKNRLKEIEEIKSRIISEYSKIKSLHHNFNYFSYSFVLINSPDQVCEPLFKNSLIDYCTIIENIILQEYCFKEYFDWASFLVALPQNHQELLNALSNSDIDDWDNSFETWYLGQVLLKYERELGGLHTDDTAISNLLALNDQLKQMQKNKIVHYWENKQWNAAHNFKKGNILSLYNYRKNKNHDSKNSLRKIINTDFELFTTFFPVLLINPVVCSSIIPLKEGIFDMVIFDEASQLRLEDTFAALIRGRYKIISGDKHQMPPSNYFHTDIALNYENEAENEEYIDDTLDIAESESLLKYAEDSGYKYSYLDFHYRSRHPYLIDFSNAAFYGSRLVPMPAKQNYKPIRFIQVSGIYSNSSNVREAKEIIRILFNEIKPDLNGNYPSVGIATLNLYQRNLILDEIQIECYREPKSLAIYEQITKSGFFVKNLENIQGDEKDIIIISTTFGLNQDDKFRQNFGPLNQDKGYRLLNVIITRAKLSLYVVTSIPTAYYSRYREEIETKGNVGKGIFYAYLNYAEAIEKDNDIQRLEILNIISKHCYESIKKEDTNFVESPFEQEVYELLCKKFGKENITLQYQCGGFRIDFVLRRANGQLVAIECDGASYHSSEVAYSYDLYRQKQLESLGFTFYRIWSTNFWYSPDSEIDKLAKFVNELDSDNTKEMIGLDYPQHRT